MTQTKDLLLGIDIGTTGAKCTFYDIKGNSLFNGYTEYRMIHPKDGWTEQNPHIWWQAVCDNLQMCIEDGADTSRVACIGVSSTNAVMLIGKNDKVVYNGIGLHDQRSESQVHWLREHLGEDMAMAITGNSIEKGSFALPTLRWFIDNRPELVEEAEKFLIPNGYIIKLLTGEYSIDKPRSGLSLLNDLTRGGWSQEIVSAAKIPEKLLPAIYDSTSIVGEVTKKAARATGLCAGTPVIAGAIDTIAATIGSGATDGGDCAITIGSSGRICQISSKPVFKKHVLSTPGALGRQFTAIQTTDNAGISLKWFRDTFGKMILQDALSAGVSIYEQMNRLCAQSQPLKNHLIYLPYLSGEKSPIWDPNARGVFFGVSLDTTYSDFVRSVMEGVAFSIRHCMEGINEITIDSGSDSPIPIGGGVANSDIWCQIFSDVLNRPVIQLAVEETETLGDVILAAQAVNIKEVPADFGKTLAKKGKIKTPNKQLLEFYDEKFIKYKQLYSSIKDLF